VAVSCACLFPQVCRLEGHTQHRSHQHAHQRKQQQWLLQQAGRPGRASQSAHGTAGGTRGCGNPKQAGGAPGNKMQQSQRHCMPAHPRARTPSPHAAPHLRQAAAPRGRLGLPPGAVWLRQLVRKPGPNAAATTTGAGRIIGAAQQQCRLRIQLRIPPAGGESGAWCNASIEAQRSGTNRPSWLEFARQQPPTDARGAPGQGFHAGYSPLAPPAVRGRLEAASHAAVPLLLADFTLQVQRSAAAATAARRHRGRAGAAGGRERPAGATAAGSIAAAHGCGRLPAAAFYWLAAPNLM
jgi:hypothetical protein